MKRVNVYRVSDNHLGWTADFEDPTDWIDAQIAKNSWGMPERQVPDPDWIPTDDPNATAPIITMPAEYRIEITDLPANYNYAYGRALAYPPLQALADAIVHQATDDGAAMRAYIAACNAVKTRFPKPAQGEN